MAENGGGSDRLAPVIPLFGGRRAADPAAPSTAEDAERIVPRRTGDAGLWRSTWTEETAAPGSRTASVTGDRDAEGSPSERHPAHGARSAPRLQALHAPAGKGDAPAPAPDAEQLRQSAEEMLVRKLRTRSLSVSESRTALKGFESEGQRLSVEGVDDVIDDFCRRGYLDDALLADQLVISGIERKGQGRVALSRALSQRGIPRDVIDAALDELPDDDADRALEYARTKARSLTRLDPDTALRRLVGQLARRGYAGSVAMTAAKQALAEASFGRPTSGVRFVDSD